MHDLTPTHTKAHSAALTAAVATIAAAIIGAAALLINGRNERLALEHQNQVLQANVSGKSADVQNLQASLAAVRQELGELKSTSSSGHDRQSRRDAESEQTPAPSTAKQPPVSSSSDNAPVQSPTRATELRTTDTSAPRKEPVEEPATAGSIRGSIVVCKFGVAPSGQAWGNTPEHICLKTDDGRVVKITYSRHINVPVYYRGQRYEIIQMSVGDYVEARVEDDGASEPLLKDIQVIRSAVQ